MEKQYQTVSELNKYIKGKVDNDDNLSRIYLKGEISNCKLHTRGHLYFSIKDENSKISAIMFKGNASKLKFTPTDGMKVLIIGKISVYEAAGSYQVYTEEMTEDGVGNLYVAFEQLKEKLKQEGLFDPIHKKKIPKMPRRIGIITASTGAAIRDITSTIRRRYPIAETILFPSLVQGDNAKDEIVKQIKLAEEYNIDTLIVGRGGGSIEDLWAFNEEIVARAIYNSKIPIISAVGHEVDFTIADFVADLRAPTPTGAAEMAVPDVKDIINYLNQVKIRLTQNINKQIEHKKEKLFSLKNIYFLKNPKQILESKEQSLDIVITKLNTNYKQMFTKKQNGYNNLINKLEALSPFSVLKRGYGIVKKEKKVITELKTVKINDIITIELDKGYVGATVTNIKELENER